MKPATDSIRDLSVTGCGLTTDPDEGVVEVEYCALTLADIASEADIILSNSYRAESSQELIGD
jgi:hypothetical protein